MDKKIQQLKVKIKDIKKVKGDVFLLSFSSPSIARTVLPGNFLHLKIPLTILRRPFSVHKIESNKIYILFRIRGRGTKILSQYRKGDYLDIIGPLGKGFDYEQRTTNNEQRILVAGGMGVAPLVFLAEKLRETQNSKLKTQNLVLLGAKNKHEILCERDFKQLGYKVLIATDDGSKGFKGTVAELLKNLFAKRYMLSPTQIYACGPKEMFLEIHKILKKYPQVNCQVSFEQFMGCGLGICAGCVIETKKGYKKVCKDGPVFNIKDIFSLSAEDG